MNANPLQPFDSVAARAVAFELDGVLVGGRLDKIQQPAARELLLVFRNTGLRRDAEQFHDLGSTLPAGLPARQPGSATRTARLVVSCQGVFSRLHLTATKAPPGRPGQAPPPFCLSLRKHLEGARLLEVKQLGLERAIALHFEAVTESGLLVDRRLVAELGGAHSNVILLDEADRIIAALRHVTEAMSRVRQILPGLAYDLPPLDPSKHDPRGTDVRVALDRAGKLDQALVKTFHSLSRMAIGQICLAAGLDPDRDPQTLQAAEIATLQQAWERALGALERGEFDPRHEGGPTWDYSLQTSRAIRDSIPGLAFADSRGSTPPAPLAPVSELLDGYYGARSAQARLETRRSKLLADIDARIAKLEARIAHADKSRSEVDEAERHRVWGDLLLAYTAQVPPGANQVELPDFESGLPVKIPLDPARSAVENAQRHYRAFRKAQGARQEQERIRTESLFETAHWGEVRQGIEAAMTTEDMDRAAAALVGTDPGKKGQLTVEGRPGRYRSADGLEILVGRNNRQNDLVSFRLARPEDWWFHVQKGPGAHVIVRSPPGDRPIPDRTGFEAALLAAWFSRSRTDTRVAVAFTRRKHVRKPQGAKPGFVMYDHERVVVVQPDSGQVAGIAQLE